MPPENRGHEQQQSLEQHKSSFNHHNRLDGSSSITNRLSSAAQIKHLLYKMYKNGESPPSFSNALLKPAVLLRKIKNKMASKRDHGFRPTPKSVEPELKPVTITSVVKKPQKTITIPNKWSEFLELNRRTSSYNNGHQERADLSSFKKSHEKLKDSEGIKKLRWMFGRSGRSLRNNCSKNGGSSGCQTDNAMAKLSVPRVSQINVTSSDNKTGPIYSEEEEGSLKNWKALKVLMAKLDPLSQRTLFNKLFKCSSSGSCSSKKKHKRTKRQVDHHKSNNSERWVCFRNQIFPPLKLSCWLAPCNWTVKGDRHTLSFFPSCLLNWMQPKFCSSQGTLFLIFLVGKRIYSTREYYLHSMY